MTGGSTLSCYEVYSRLNSDREFAKKFDQLEGKILGCFCPPTPCHTDIIIKLLKERKC